ncbi:MFS transporter [Streptomyces sp. NPDC007856]|uniref:MFS transporter n=1 Tax=Streptomyces sp. NPDC007856 TaxID=3364781 RepID=UPI0036A39AD5
MTSIDDKIGLSVQPTRTPSFRRQRALVPVLLFLGMLVAVISSLGAPLIPTIAAVDHVSMSSAQWSLTVTMLVGAVATPVMGRLGDGPHRRKAILTGLAVVLVGSVLAALPLGFAWLLAGRALQGAGIGLMPLAMATVRDAVPPERARPALATLSLTSAAGVGLGYPVTGLLARYFGLHSGFWFAAIAAAATLAATTVVLPPSPKRPAHRLDLLGAVLLGLGLAGLLFAITQAERWGWTSARLLALAAVSVLLLVWWAAHELRTPHPLVDVRLVRHRAVLAADLTAVLSGVGLYLLMSLVTRFVQTPAGAGYGFGASVVVAGLVLVPFSAASMVAGRLVRLLARTIPLARLLPLGCLISLVGMVLFVLARSSLWQVFVTTGITGLGVGFIFSVMPALIVGAVPAQETGSAISFNQVVKYIGYSIGSALSAVVLQAHTTAGRTLPTDDGYGTAGVLGCAVWVVTALVAYLLLRPHPPGTRTVASAGTQQADTGPVPPQGGMTPHPTRGDR